MSNKEILEEILVHFGKEDAILFCKMEAKKYRLQWEDAKRRRINLREDFSYDVEWWENKYEEIINN